MSNKQQFFQCFSINLHRFLKANGLRPMSKNIHDKGVDITNTKTGETVSFSTLGSAADATGISYADLVEIHKDILDLKSRNSQDCSVSRDEFVLSYRERVFWVYLRDDKFEKAFSQWKKTNPKRGV